VCGGYVLMYVQRRHRTRPVRQAEAAIYINDEGNLAIKEITDSLNKINGNMIYATDDYSALHEDAVIICDGNSTFTISLYPVSQSAERRVVIKKAGAGAGVITVAAYAGDLIDGVANITLSSAWDKITLVSGINDNAWHVIG
jgi:hypothetical protein